MKRPSAKLLALIGVSVVLLALVLASYPQVVSYWRFSMRSQQYYAKVADACDELIVRSSVSHLEIKGAELRALPAILSGLNPDHVIIETNLVRLVVGGGVVSHAITWRSAENDQSSWQLSLSIPDKPSSKIVFSRRKSRLANEARHRMSGNNINLKFGHRRMPLLGALCR